MKLTNYLFFTNNCEAALNFYMQCGLGQIKQVMRYGDRGMPFHNESMRGRIMHAQFEGPGVSFFASDNHDAEPMRGSAHMLVLETQHEVKLLFDQLSKGGNVSTPLAVQPWGTFFGKLTDQFGVQWMLTTN
jgi:PhnB protein